LDKDILPAFGQRPIESISRIELMTFVTELEKRGNTSLAIKVRGWLKVLFADALNHEEISINPADNLKPSHYATGAETTHHPSVSFSELPDLLVAVERSGAHILTKLYLRMLLLTGVRQSELRGANWNEVDLKSAIWNISAERMKMRKPHSVPLPRQAIEILKQVRLINPSGRWFDIGGKEFGRSTLNSFLDRIGYAGRQSPHGFRHLIATELNSRGYNPDWVELQLAHKIGGSQIRSIYVHSDFLENRRVMMQEWADAIDLAANPGNKKTQPTRAGLLVGCCSF
jgi:integrase